MNKQNSSITVTNLHLHQISSVRYGERTRRQLFQLNTDRLDPLCKGEDNEYDIQIDYKSQQNLDSEEEKKIEIIKKRDEKWTLKKGYGLIIVLRRFIKQFNSVRSFFHPQQLSYFQKNIINDACDDNQDNRNENLNGQGSSLNKIIKQGFSEQLQNRHQLNCLIKCQQIKKRIIKKEKIKKFLKIWSNFFKSSKILMQQFFLFLVRVIPLINSQNNFYFLWDLLIFLISIFVAIYLPIEMAFLSNTWNYSDLRFTLQSSFLYIFVLNSLIQMNSTYFDSDCALITDQKRIIVNYFKTQFYLDFLLIISLAVSENSGYVTYYSLRIFIFIWRLVYHNYNVTRFLDQYFYSDYWKAIRRLIELFIQILFSCHIFSCYFYLLGKYSMDNYNNSWLTTNNENMGDSIKSHYINSFYFSVVTMSTIGYGDISPINDDEQLFMIFMSLFASMLFGYTINSLATIFSDYEQKQKEYNKKNQELVKYFRDHTIDSSLQNRAKQFLEYTQNEGVSNEKTTQCLDYLSPFLKEEILKNVHNKTIEKISILNKFYSKEFLKAINLFFQEKIFAPEEPIVMAQCRSQPRIYFIHKGQIQLFLQIGESLNGEHIRSLGIKKEGEVFGLSEFYLNSEDPKICVRSKGITVIHYISREDFFQQLQLFPGDREIFFSQKDSLIFEKNYSVIDESCLSCNKLDHDTLRCPSIDYMSQSDSIIKRYERNLKFFMKNFKRKQTQRNAINSLAFLQNLNKCTELFQQTNLFQLFQYGDEYLTQFDGILIEDIMEEEQQDVEHKESYSTYQQNLQQDQKELDENVVIQKSSQNINQLTKIKSQIINIIDEPQQQQPQQQLLTPNNGTSVIQSPVIPTGSIKEKKKNKHDMLNAASRSLVLFKHQNKDEEEYTKSIKPPKFENKVQKHQFSRNITKDIESQIQEADSTLIQSNEVDQNNYKINRSKKHYESINMQSEIQNNQNQIFGINNPFEKFNNFTHYQPDGNISKIQEKLNSLNQIYHQFHKSLNNMKFNRFLQERKSILIDQFILPNQSLQNQNKNDQNIDPENQPSDKSRVPQEFQTQMNLEIIKE